MLVLLALALWLYSFYRLYLVWQNTLNFQESSIQGPQGWDMLVNWILERIRKDTTCVTVSCNHLKTFPLICTLSLDVARIKL